jgi:hypothetical protein
MNPQLEQMMSEPPPPQKKPLPRGPIVIGVFFIFGIAMSLFAIYYNAMKMKRALAFWGAADAQNIQTGSKVEFWDVKIIGAARATSTDGTRKETGADDVTFTLDGSEWAQSNRRDVSEAKGLVHLRDALLDDFQYDWNDTMRPDEKLEPDRALVFYSGTENIPGKHSITTVLIDSKKNFIGSLRTNRRASSKKLVEAYLKVVESPAKTTGDAPPQQLQQPAANP